MASLRNRVFPRIFLAGLFGLGIAIGGFFWNKIRLPFRNPCNITGFLTKIRFSPYNNIARFLFVVTAPCLLLIVAYVLAGRLKLRLFIPSEGSMMVRREKQPATNRRAICFLLLSLMIFAAISHLTVINYGVWVDAFHDGETLAPAISYMDGQVPYKDFQFAHGLYQDPLRSVLAFKLFGKGIASMKALQTINQLMMILLLAFLLYRLFQGGFTYTFVTMLILLALMGIYGNSIHLIVAEHREMIPILFLILLGYLHDFLVKGTEPERKEQGNGKVYILCFFLSFLPFACLAYSIDRGTYLLIAYLLLALVVYFFFLRKSRLKKGAVISSFLGIVAGVLLLGYLLRWGFADFIHFSYVFVPKCKELADGLIYPIRQPQGYILVILIAFNTFWLLYKYLQCVQEEGRHPCRGAGMFFRRYLAEFALWLLALLSFRNALGRADIPHIQYSSLLSFVLLFLILFKHGTGEYFSRNTLKTRARKFFPIVLVVLVIVSSGFSIYRIIDRDILAGAFPFGTADETYERTTGWSNALGFLKDNLGPQERFMTMTNEPLWYYFMDMPSPTKYPFAFYSMQESCQEEMIRDMETKNVKLLIMNNENSPFCNLDGIPNAERMPLVYGYIEENYSPLTKTDGIDIWIRSDHQCQ